MVTIPSTELRALLEAANFELLKAILNERRLDVRTSNSGVASLRNERINRILAAVKALPELLATAERVGELEAENIRMEKYADGLEGWCDEHLNRAEQAEARATRAEDRVRELEDQHDRANEIVETLVQARRNHGYVITTVLPLDRALEAFLQARALLEPKT